MSVASRAYKRLGALYRSVLCRTQALNKRGSSRILAARHRSIVEPLEPRCLLSGMEVLSFAPDVPAAKLGPHFTAEMLAGQAGLDRKDLIACPAASPEYSPSQ